MCVRYHVGQEAYFGAQLQGLAQEGAQLLLDFRARPRFCTPAAAGRRRLDVLQQGLAQQRLLVLLVGLCNRELVAETTVPGQLSA